MANASGASPAKESNLAFLLPLMREKNVTVTPADFHQAVNLVFHEFESEVYDEIHSDMRNSLPAPFGALANDWLATGVVPHTLRVLDIGCGTGLSCQLLLETALGQRVESLDLLDTSPEMLRRCGERMSSKGVSYRLIQGTLDALPQEPAYDLILTCSVLHHIPDLTGFLTSVSTLQAPGGVFWHLQDPNGDYFSDEELQKRMDRLSKHASRRFAGVIKRLSPKRIGNFLQRKLSGRVERSYMDRVNDELIRRGVMKHPLTEMELWRITDLRVYDGKGVSVTALRDLLPEYELVSSRPYSFFGELHSELPPALRREDQELFRAKAQSGQHLAALWHKRQSA